MQRCQRRAPPGASGSATTPAARPNPRPPGSHPPPPTARRCAHEGDEPSMTQARPRPRHSAPTARPQENARSTRENRRRQRRSPAAPQPHLPRPVPAGRRCVRLQAHAVRRTPFRSSSITASIRLWRRPRRCAGLQQRCSRARSRTPRDVGVRTTSPRCARSADSGPSIPRRAWPRQSAWMHADARIMPSVVRSRQVAVRRWCRRHGDAEVGFSARLTTMSWPEEMPPSTPPA